MSLDAVSIRPDRWTAVKRGLWQRCPACGRGHLFRAYLKVADTCAACGEDLSAFRADDGPAWATILVVGHLTVPFFIVAAREDAPTWLYLGVLGPLTVLLTIGLLPLFKGAFMGLLWSMDMRG